MFMKQKSISYTHFYNHSVFCGGEGGIWWWECTSETQYLIHLPKRCKTFAIFLGKNYHSFNSLFLFLSILEILMFSFMCLFAVRAFWLILHLTFAKFVEFLKRHTVMGGRYFLIFQPKYMLNLCLNLNKYLPIYTYNR